MAGWSAESNPGNFGNEIRGIEFQHFREVEQVNHIHAALTTFEAGDERLIFAEPRREFSLRHASRFALLNKERDQGFMTI